ncbi:hypothetical protein [Enterococcus phage EFGrKN]|uniref:Uncharacterized protein n=4 Tax=Schiekvirus TaxID=2732968 RepID=A0AAE9KTC5_9CAUD|nr:hypothetical protein A2_10 [Enterococcus phage vB_EfaM_A2]QOV05748.1 hypothetical protein [Enterococcus phage EFGrKN]QPI18429.1 hypothetical protein [Enterococcus phage EFGrNG]UPW35245.1 hypothetical protein KEBGJNKE_00006 [Enterococcus phage vB_OCPT_Bop]
MSKTVETVITLMKRAEKKGVAIKRARQRDMWGVGDLQEVYRVENNGKTVSLYHYETLTAKVDLENMQLIEVYGESRSDGDSVATFLSELGFKNFDFGFKPVNGGFWLFTNKDGERQETYLDEQGETAVINEFNRVQA